jgi:phage portal protein BeeE
VLSLPSQKFGDFESSQYANFVEADRVFYTDAVIPNVELFNNQFQKDCLDSINARTQRNYHLVLDKDRVEALNTVTETQAPATTTEDDDN